MRLPFFVLLKHFGDALCIIILRRERERSPFRSLKQKRKNNVFCNLHDIIISPYCQSIKFNQLRKIRNIYINKKKGERGVPLISYLLTYNGNLI